MMLKNYSNLDDPKASEYMTNKSLKISRSNHFLSSKNNKGENIHSEDMFQRAYGTRGWKWYRNLLATCIQYGMPGTWIDLGAGLGLFVECAQRFGIDCIGFEGSEYAVKAAKQRFPSINMFRHYLEDGLPFRDNTISTVVCNQTIEHIPASTAMFMLKESQRILKFGGAIIVNSPSLYNKDQRKEEGHINLYTPTRLKNELARTGFTKIIPMDSPLHLLGNSRIGIFIITIIFKLCPFDCLSSSANCVAYKV